MNQFIQFLVDVPLVYVEVHDLLSPFPIDDVPLLEFANAVRVAIDLCVEVI